VTTFEGKLQSQISSQDCHKKWLKTIEMTVAALRAGRIRPRILLPPKTF
jgi:hypothetical protein